MRISSQESVKQESPSIATGLEGERQYIEKVQDRYSWMGVGVFTSHCSSFMHEDFEAAEAAAKYELGREAEFTGESNEDRAAAIDAGPQAVSLAMKKLNNKIC